MPPTVNPADIHSLHFYLPGVSDAGLERLDARFTRIIRGLGGGVVYSSFSSESRRAVRGPSIEDMTYGEPFTPQQNLFDDTTQEQLNTPVWEALQPEGGTLSRDMRRLSMRLQELGIQSVRDVILGGYDYLLYGNTGLGQGPRLQLKAILQELCPHIPFKEGWRPEEAAQFCHSLQQVPLYALRDRKGHPLDWKVVGGRRRSVFEFLSTPESELTPAERQLELRASALAFAGAFERASWSRPRRRIQKS